MDLKREVKEGILKKTSILKMDRRRGFSKKNES